MSITEIEKFAKEQGYDGVSLFGEWRGFTVYYPEIEGSTEKEPAIVGIPFIVLVKDEKIRMSTVDEAFEFIDDIDEIEEVRSLS